MNKDALLDLIKIASIEGLTRKDGVIAREQAILDWTKYWIEEVEASQGVIKTSMTSEEEDFVKYHMAGKLTEELMENCIDMEILPSKIKTKITAVRRRVKDENTSKS